MSDLSNYTKLDIKLADIENFSDLAAYGDVYCLEVETTPEHWELDNGVYDTDPTFEESDSFDYIHDAESWQTSYTGGVLKKYYEKYPEEDLWNTVENRAVNFNDRHYKANIGNEAVECDAKWESDNAQRILIGNAIYFAEIFYDMNPREVELFSNPELTESANKTLSITKVSFSDDCQHCWEGSINAPGAKYPWICPTFDKNVNSKLIFRYEGKSDVYPWNDTLFGTGQDMKIWGCASIPSEFNDDSFKVDANGEGSSFDINKFNLVLEHQDVVHVDEVTEEVLESITASNFATLKEDFEDADLYVAKQEEQTPDEPTPSTPDTPQDEDKPKEEKTPEEKVNDVLERKGIDTSNMTESEKVAKATGLNFVNDEWLAKKKEDGTFKWFIPSGKAWE